MLGCCLPSRLYMQQPPLLYLCESLLHFNTIQAASGQAALRQFRFRLAVSSCQQLVSRARVREPRGHVYLKPESQSSSSSCSRRRRHRGRLPRGWRRGEPRGRSRQAPAAQAAQAVRQVAAAAAQETAATATALRAEMDREPHAHGRRSPDPRRGNPSRSPERQGCTRMPPREPVAEAVADLQWSRRCTRMAARGLHG